MQGKIGRIGSMEFFSLALALCMSSLLLLGTAEKTAAQQSWLLVLLALPVGLLHWLLFMAWARLYAGQSFGQALLYAFGRAGGKIALFAYALFWLLLAELFTGCVAGFWASLGANNLPLWLYAALFLLAAAASAAAGGTALARLALLVVVPALVLTLANLGLTAFGGSADFGNLLPFWPPYQKTSLGGWPGLLYALSLGLLFFSGFSALLPHLAQVRELKRQQGSFLTAVLLALALWLALAGGSQMVLGASLPLYEFPILQVFRLAEFGHWFSRFEVIGAVLLVMLALLRASVLLAAAVGSLRELWGIKNQQRGPIWLVALGCWLLLIVLFVMWRRFARDLQISLGLLIILALIFSLLLPALAVIFGALKFQKQHKNIIVKHERY